ncbi:MULTISPECIES: RCC1 domain-containing protein [Francisella]|uniref:Regulator n=1 Tax=Francisella opportunistica TaxID=2016517 RepID=A0A345JP83_9GAMM|nr:MULTISPECIES: regulator [Francisella]APC90788.1 Regulator of chromosome condensation RCC1 family protein [Francisella sp. MA067296]AXH29129.1 regulator [Francisella opportunistica]
MKKNILLVILLSLWCNAFANPTFTQKFFSSYDPSLDSSFAYKNDDYRDDAKIEKYDHKFSKDDSDNYNCAFDGSGQIRCGDYKIKQPQYSDTDVVKKVKAHYKKLQDVKNVTKGDDFNCALDNKDDVYCWGSNKRGQLGSETSKSKIKNPLRIDIDNNINFKKVYTKAHYACALDENGYAYCWGDGSNGEVGNGEKGRFATPQKVKTDIQFSRLSMARTYTCGVAKQTNEIYCWGKSKKGQTNLNSAIPVKI